MPTCPAPTSAPADRDALFGALCQSDVLTDDQLRRAAMVVTGPGVACAPSAAAALVADGLLTRFQADRLLAGRTDGFVLGPHVVLDLIGRGSASRVYRARHRTMNRIVAVKVLAAERTRSAAARQRFRDAARAAGKLSHPNVVTALDANERNGRFYLVLEFVDGPSLEALVRRCGPLPVDEACEFVRQVAHGLAHAHGLGTAHRDLCPASVLVGRAGPGAPPVVRIGDFGFASASGAIEYRAPEALANPDAADERADLYSLGCVFHFLLTGHPPFAGSAGEVARGHRECEPPRVDRVRPDVRPELAAVVHRLLAKRPEARFASAGELLDHLDAVCIPVAAPADWVSFEMPAAEPFAQDSGGYLTGHAALPPEVAAGASPWEQITTATAAETTRAEPRPRTPAPERSSLWTWAGLVLLLGITLLVRR